MYRIESSMHVHRVYLLHLENFGKGRACGAGGLVSTKRHVDIVEITENHAHLSSAHLEEGLAVERVRKSLVR